MPTRLSMSAADWLLLVVLSVLWGGSFFFPKIAVTELPPLTLALCRVGIAAAILAVLSRASGTSLESSLRTCRPFAVLGLLNSALPHTLIFWGQTHIPSALASILNATTPIFTVLVAHLATRDEKLDAKSYAAWRRGLSAWPPCSGPMY
jgi:drug/metabolite transporter (DMT)-like permease